MGVTDRRAETAGMPAKVRIPRTLRGGMRTKNAIAVAETLALHRGTILPAVDRELDRWRSVAAAIPDPEPRAIALAALTEKAANPKATALFAALAPRRRRRAALATSTALQVAIDYLDSVGERPTPDPLGDGLRLHRALESALRPGASPEDWPATDPNGEAGGGRGAGGDGGADLDDDGYLTGLVAACRRGAAALPAGDTVLPFARRAARRCGEGQSHTHAAGLARAAAGDGAEDAFETWARELDPPAGCRWWETAAGAASSVAAHALIALAADPSATAAQAEAVDAAYFPAIGALTVILDDLVDRAADVAGGEHSFLDYYAGATEMEDRLAAIVADATARVGGLPHPRRQTAILTGVVAYYVAAIADSDPATRSIAERLLAAAPPAAAPLAAFLRRVDD